MRLTLTCEHGTRTVEVDEGREGVGNVCADPGERSFASRVITETMPRCPYCENENRPTLVVEDAPVTLNDWSIWLRRACADQGGDSRSMYVHALRAFEEFERLVARERAGR